MIEIDLDVAMAKAGVRAGELADRIGITPQNLSVLKNGRAKAIRFSTLSAICNALGCQPGDVLRFVPGGETAPDCEDEP